MFPDNQLSISFKLIISKPYHFAILILLCVFVNQYNLSQVFLFSFLYYSILFQVFILYQLH